MWKNAHRIGLLLAVGAGLTKSAVPATTAASAASSGAVDAPPALNLPAGPLAKVNGTEISRTEFEQKYVKMTKAFTARKKDIPENLAKRY